MLDEILAVLRTVKDDKQKLEKIHKFIFDEIYEEPDEEIPEKYHKVVALIADNLTAGFISYFNPETLEVEDIPEGLARDPEEFEAMTGETWEYIGIKHESWKRCVEIAPLHSNESFRIMEGFVDQMEDSRFRDELINALNRRRPFANFNHLIHNSDYREAWFKFRKEKLEWYVWMEIEPEIFRIEDIDE